MKFKVHYYGGVVSLESGMKIDRIERHSGLAACVCEGKVPVTARRSEVTCGNCKRTRFYKEHQGLD